MARNRKLTDEDKIFIDRTLDLEPEVVAEKLGLTVKQVLGQRSFAAQQRQLKIEADNSAYHLYETKTVGGKSGATVMTESASMGVSEDTAYSLKMSKLRKQIDEAYNLGDWATVEKLSAEMTKFEFARKQKMKGDDSDHILTRPRF